MLYLYTVQWSACITTDYNTLCLLLLFFLRLFWKSPPNIGDLSNDDLPVCHIHKANCQCTDPYTHSWWPASSWNTSNFKACLLYRWQYKTKCMWCHCHFIIPHTRSLVVSPPESHRRVCIWDYQRLSSSLVPSHPSFPLTHLLINTAMFTCHCLPKYSKPKLVDLLGGHKPPYLLILYPAAWLN